MWGHSHAVHLSAVTGPHMQDADNAKLKQQQDKLLQRLSDCRTFADLDIMQTPIAIPEPDPEKFELAEDPELGIQVPCRKFDESSLREHTEPRIEILLPGKDKTARALFWTAPVPVAQGC